MAIRIPSANISERKSSKILKNKINSVAYTESNLVSSIESVFGYPFSIYSSNTNSYTNNINDYTNNMLKNEYTPEYTYNIITTSNGTTYEYHYAYFKISNIKYPYLNRQESLSLSISQRGSNNGNPFNYEKIVSENTTTGEYLLEIYDSDYAFEDATFAGAHLGGSIGTVKDFTGYVKAGVVFRDYDFDVLILLKTYEKDNSNNLYYNIQESYNISFALKVYNKTSENKGATDNANFTLETNELLSSSTKIGSDTIGKYLSNKIIEEYSNGKQNATVLCSINDYYDYDSGKKVIGANNPQLLNASEYVELWNATYDNGVVRQVTGEIPFASGVANMNENIDEYGRYFQVYDKPMIPSLKINDSVTLNYKIDGKAYSLNTYIVDRYNGALALSSQQGGSGLLVLLNENGYSIVAYVNINATQQTNGQWVNVGSSSQIIVQVLTAPNGTPNIEIEIPSVGYQFHLQTYDTYPNIISEYVKKVYYNGLVYFTFIKQDSFNYVRFKLNGKEIDTGISFDISSLENGKTYCFSANVSVEEGQGYISWDNMMFNYGARPMKHQEYLPMTFAVYDEVIPMVSGYDGNDYPMSLNADGTPKVFRVLGMKIFYDGAVWQELSLQEC